MKKTTIDRRLMILPLKADQNGDNHPEVLREWTQDGHTTPVHWFHVAAYTHTGHLMQLLRERLHTDEGKTERTVTLCRGIYWHVSREYVEEIARQLCSGERQAFAWSTGSTRFIPYPVDHAVVSRCDEKDVWHEERRFLANRAREITTGDSS